MSDIQNYQRDLKDILFPIVHNNYHKNAENIDRHVAYSIKDNTLRSFLHNWYMFQTTEDFDFEWYEQCKKYIDSLSHTDKFILRCYTFKSDEFVNRYIRDPLTFLEAFPIQQMLLKMEEEGLFFFLPELVKDEGVEMQWYSNGKLKEQYIPIASELVRTQISNNHPRLVQYILRYIEHLRRILQNAPRPSYDILVFRGVKSDYLKSEEPGMFRGFTSTTWYPQIAYFFGEDERLVYEFRVSKLTPALCIHSLSEHQEYEVLLDTDIHGVADRTYEKYYLDLDVGSGNFPASHMWNPEETVLEGTPKPIIMNSRVVLVHPEMTGLHGGFVKNRTRSSRSTRLTRSTRIRKSIRSTHKIMFDSKDLSSAAFVPTSSSTGQFLLQSLRKFQQSNPRNKKTHPK